MVVSEKLTLGDVRPEVRFAVEKWLQMADPKHKNRYFVFFASGGGGTPASNGGRLPKVSGAATSPEKAQLDAAIKELELSNWNTTYSANNHTVMMQSPTKSPAKTHAQLVLAPLMREILAQSAHAKVNRIVGGMAGGEVDEFVKLLRSLSIAFEQFRTRFSSEYIVQYVPKQFMRSDASVEDARASSLTGPVTWAPPKQKIIPGHIVASRMSTPQQTKPALKPKGQTGLLSWASGGDQNSTYRHFYHKYGDTYPSVTPSRYDLSFSCGRTVPDSLVGDEFRVNPVLLPSDLETRHRLKQRHPMCQPSWHLLYPNGTVFTDTPGPHNKGELSIYGGDFLKNTSVVKTGKPTLDPFSSAFNIAMSDYNDLNTVYQTTICRSATMEYDRNLV